MGKLKWDGAAEDIGRLLQKLNTATRNCHEGINHRPCQVGLAAARQTTCSAFNISSAGAGENVRCGSGVRETIALND